eukprot:9193311-Pyramimonas_sp.AAC.1
MRHCDHSRAAASWTRLPLPQSPRADPPVLACHPSEVADCALEGKIVVHKRVVDTHMLEFCERSCC